MLYGWEGNRRSGLTTYVLNVCELETSTGTFTTLVSDMSRFLRLIPCHIAWRDGQVLKAD